MKNNALGFTLVDVLISTFILSILLTLMNITYSAVNNYWATEETRAALYTGFITAKTQAMISGQSTVICPSSDGMNCLSNPVWQYGWIIFQDDNHNRERDFDEMTLVKQPALSTGITLRSNQGRPRLVFQQNGSNGGTNATFTYCNHNDVEHAKNFIISNTARIRTASADPNLAEQTCNL